MDKVLPILEKYVQWIALGIGALFLALMAYSYFVQQPVTVDLGGQPVRPGEVDPAIAEGSSVAALKRDIETREPVPTPPVPPPSAEFRNVVLETVVAGPVAPVGPGPVAQPGPTPPETVAGMTLPTVPAPAYSGFFSMGRGLYQWPVLQPPPAAVAGVPVPVVPNVVPNAPAQMAQRDFDWWTGSFDVDLVKVANAFAAAQIPPQDPNLSKTAFLAAELYRQEKQIDGSWGPETKVPALPQYLPLMREVPKPTDTRQAKAEYMTWAAQNIGMLVQPVFPQVVAGDPWHMPGTEKPPKVNQVSPDGTGAEGIEGIEGIEGGVRPGIPGVPGTPGVPALPPRPVAPVAPQGGYEQPGVVQPGFTPEGSETVPTPEFNPGFTPDEGGGYVEQSGDTSGIPGAANPGGTFNPADYALAAQQQGFTHFPVTLYGHDTTVQPGKTYRFKMRYTIRNPLFLIPNVQPKYSDVLALDSAFSDWSPEVSIPPRVEFWVNAVTDKIGAPATAEFNVFIAKNDRWEPLTVQALPGDQIARGDANSGWSLVDIRKTPDGKSWQVLIADSNGRMEMRDLLTDQNDPRQRELKGVPDAPVEGIEGIEGREIPEGGVRPPGTRPPPRGFTREE